MPGYEGTLLCAQSETEREREDHNGIFPLTGSTAHQTGRSTALAANKADLWCHTARVTDRAWSALQLFLGPLIHGPSTEIPSKVFRVKYQPSEISYISSLCYIGHHSSTNSRATCLAHLSSHRKC